MSSINQTLEIQVLDTEPDVAAEVLNQVLAILKDKIEQFRSERAASVRKNALVKRKEAGVEYHAAMQAYTDYADSHENVVTSSVNNKLKQLEKEYKLKYALYEKAALEYTRAEYLEKKANTSFAVVKRYNVSQKPLYPKRWSYAVAFAMIAAVFCLWHALYVRRGKRFFSDSMDFGDWFSPWSITVLIWTLVLGLYYLLGTKLYPITQQFYACFVIWLLIFCPTAFITYSLTGRPGTAPRIIPKSGWRGIDFNKSIFTFFFTLSLVITPLYIYQVVQIVMMFSTENLMNNVRMLALYGDGPGLLGYSNVINQALFVVALWAYPRVPLWQVVILAFACLLNSLAIMEKGTMFFVFVCIIFILFEKKAIKIRTIVVAGILLVGVFYIFNLARAEEDSDYQRNETLLDFLAMYALSPPVAFCQLKTDVTPQFGTNTFETVYLFLERFGVKDIIVKEKLQEFVQVPVPSNVYTIFQPFFIDFGNRGIAFFALLYGVVSGWLYRLFRNGNNVGTCLYTFMTNVLILQFYQENILLSMVFVIQFTFFTTLFTQKYIRLSFNTPRQLCQETVPIT